MDVISVSSYFSGNFSFGKYARIEGKIDGKISSSGILIVGEKAILNAELSGNLLVVQGKVCGNITAQEAVIIQATAQVYGDIKAPKIEIEDGAKIDGNILMSKYHPSIFKKLETIN